MSQTGENKKLKIGIIGGTGTRMKKKKEKEN